MTSFSFRLSAGQQGQQHLIQILQNYGFQVIRTGQEAWLNQAVHAALRFEHSDPMVRAVRYQPDLLVYHPDFPLAYWEVKVNTTPDTPYFAVETACYEEALARTTKGERIIFAFWEVDHTWHVNWANALEIGRDMRGRRKQADGSQTPYLLVSKTSTLPLENFLRTFGKIGICPTI